MFQSAKLGVYAEIGDYISKHPNSFTENLSTGIHRALTEKYVFMGENSVLDAIIIDHCELTIMKEKFYTGTWAFSMRKGWKYKQELDTA